MEKPRAGKDEKRKELLRIEGRESKVRLGVTICNI